jgi:hypothetical protein
VQKRSGAPNYLNKILGYEYNSVLQFLRGGGRVESSSLNLSMLTRPKVSYPASEVTFVLVSVEHVGLSYA